MCSSDIPAIRLYEESAKTALRRILCFHLNYPTLEPQTQKSNLHDVPHDEHNYRKEEAPLVNFSCQIHVSYQFNRFYAQFES